MAATGTPVMGGPVAFEQAGLRHQMSRLRHCLSDEGLDPRTVAIDAAGGAVVGAIAGPLGLTQRVIVGTVGGAGMTALDTALDPGISRAGQRDQVGITVAAGLLTPAVSHTAALDFIIGLLSTGVLGFFR